MLSILSIFPVLSLSPYDLFVRILRMIKDVVLRVCRQRLGVKANTLTVSQGSGVKSASEYVDYVNQNVLTIKDLTWF